MLNFSLLCLGEQNNFNIFLGQRKFLQARLVRCKFYQVNKRWAWADTRGIFWWRGHWVKRSPHTPWCCRTAFHSPGAWGHPAGTGAAPWEGCPCNWSPDPCCRSSITPTAIIIYYGPHSRCNLETWNASDKFHTLCCHMRFADFWCCLFSPPLVGRRQF